MECKSTSVQIHRAILLAAYNQFYPARKKNPECSISDIIEPAVKILGHELSSKAAWVMSSRYDQTVLPKLFSTQTIQSEDILTLGCVPGSLMWRDERYASAVVSPTYQHWTFDDEDSDAESATEGIIYEQVNWGVGRRYIPKIRFRAMSFSGS